MGVHEESGAVRAWLDTPDVAALFAGEPEEPGGLLAFTDVPARTVNELIAGGPDVLLEQSTGDGPPLSVPLERALTLGATMSGYTTARMRDDSSFVCKSLILPLGVDAEALADLEPDEAKVLEDGRVVAWWD